MILDERLEFADATSVAAAAGTALIGDVIDLGTAVRDIGNGREIWWYIAVDTSVITGGAAGTILFKLVSDAQAAIATDGTATVHLTTATFVTDDDALNDLDAGRRILCVALPIGATYERYLGVIATIATTTVTAGAISSGLTLDPTGWRPYADAVN